MFLIFWGLNAPAAAAQDITGDLTKEILERAAEVGRVFRADAPYILRNSEDTSLPIFLRIINGVEKSRGAAAAIARRYITRDPILLEGVNFYLKPSGRERQFPDKPFLLSPESEYSVPLKADGEPLKIADRFEKTLQLPISQVETYLQENFIGGGARTLDIQVEFVLFEEPSQRIGLRIRLRGESLPRFPGWYRGDTHYHSAYTNNPAERGHPLEVTRQAALHAGLDWILVTDHSSDLDTGDYARQLEEIQKLSSEEFVFIRGQEVTAQSSQAGLLTTIHLVVFPSPEEPDRGFQATSPTESPLIETGDGSLTFPGLPLGEVLDRIAASGGFAYAAHPFDPISPILRGASWALSPDFLPHLLKDSPLTLRPGLVGLEAWNRRTEQTADHVTDPYCILPDSDPSGCFQADAEADHYFRLERAIEKGWVPLLQQSVSTEGDHPLFKVFLAAGSDAHGDFNYETSLDVVDYVVNPERAMTRGISGYAEDNALGRVATIAYSPNGMGAGGEGVLRSVRAGRTILSDGPLAAAGFDMDRNGRLDSGDVHVGGELSVADGAFPALVIELSTSVEFGPFEKLSLLLGDREGETVLRELLPLHGGDSKNEYRFSVDLTESLSGKAPGWYWVRLEARTRTSRGEGFRCYTNLIWIHLQD